MPTNQDSTNSSTPDTRLQELDRLIAKVNRARELYEKRLERAEKLARELGREVQPRLPLGDD
jgi:hypothetical protein